MQPAAPGPASPPTGGRGLGLLLAVLLAGAMGVTAFFLLAAPAYPREADLAPTLLPVTAAIRALVTSELSRPLRTVERLSNRSGLDATAWHACLLEDEVSALWLCRPDGPAVTADCEAVRAAGPNASAGLLWGPSPAGNCTAPTTATLAAPAGSLAVALWLRPGLNATLTAIGLQGPTTLHSFVLSASRQVLLQSSSPEDPLGCDGQLLMASAPAMSEDRAQEVLIYGATCQGTVVTVALTKHFAGYVLVAAAPYCCEGPWPRWAWFVCVVAGGAALLAGLGLAAAVAVQYRRLGAAVRLALHYAAKTGAAGAAADALGPALPPRRFPDVAAWCTLWAEGVAARQRDRAELLQLQDRAKEDRRLYSTLMTNEIRSPLNGLLGVVELLHETPLNPDQKEMVTLIDTSTKVLVLLLNNILDYSSMRDNSITLNAGEMLLEDDVLLTVDIINAAAVKKNLDFIIYFGSTVPDVVRADPQRVEQIIINLLSNSVKYTSEGFVTLVVNEVKRDTRENTSTVEFLVRDTGPGIPDPDVDRLFRCPAYARLGSGTTPGSLGAGLPIAVHLVEMMQGTITCRSVTGDDGHGTTVSVQIPFPVVEPCQYDPQLTQGKPAIVLMRHPNVGDGGDAGMLTRQEYLSLLQLISPADIRDNLTAMLFTLHEWGLRLTVASAPEEIWALMRADPDSIVFCDIHSLTEEDPRRVTAGRPPIEVRALCEQLQGLAQVTTVVLLLEHPVSASLSDFTAVAIQQLSQDNPDIHVLRKPIKRPELWNAVLASLGEEDRDPSSDESETALDQHASTRDILPLVGPFSPHTGSLV